jgi:hypothetical protein
MIRACGYRLRLPGAGGNRGRRERPGSDFFVGKTRGASLSRNPLNLRMAALERLKIQHGGLRGIPGRVTSGIVSR